MHGWQHRFRPFIPSLAFLPTFAPHFSHQMSATFEIDTSNSVFQKALAFVTDTQENLFLTGKAGTGKTTFLRYIRGLGKKQMAIIAPTGVAAMNAGGETIHSFLQLPLGPFLPGNSGGFGKHREGTEDKHSLLANLKLRDTKIKLLRRLELLVIDEVSMVRADVMDAIDLVLRHVRNNYLFPFGGVQMLFIGDAFQLPPVAREEEWGILREYYASPYFFDSHVLRQYPPVYIELKKIYRQKEQTFIDILNRVRGGDVSLQDIAILNERYMAEPPRGEGHIVLCTHNHIADDINTRELALLEGTTHKFEATTTGEINARNIPAEQILQLKRGAQVMFIKNDLQTPRRYYNGKIGTIADVNSSGIWVAFEGVEERVQVPLEKWRNVRYTLDRQASRITEEEVGSFTQFPLRLAWAVTVHKSQGLTLEKAILDINRSFAPGQAYVALSRCTTLQGIVLRSPLVNDNIMVDQRVIEFARSEQEEDELQHMLDDGARRAASLQLQKVFSFTDMIATITALRPDIAKRKTGPKEQNMLLMDKVLTGLHKAQDTATKFGRQIDQFTAERRDDELQQRKQAAVTYFCNEVLSPLLILVEAHFKVLDEHPKVAKQTRTFKEMKTLLQLKEKDLLQLLPTPVE